MEQIRYHPLVEADTEGTVKVPMFVTTDEKMVENSHSLYLKEIIPHYYRLISNNYDSDLMSGNFEIRCPFCGATLKQICSPKNNHKLGLYVCKKCGLND